MDKNLHDKTMEYLRGLYNAAKNLNQSWNDQDNTFQQYWGVCDCLTILGIVTNNEVEEMEKEINCNVSR